MEQSLNPAPGVSLYACKSSTADISLFEGWTGTDLRKEGRFDWFLLLQGHRNEAKPLVEEIAAFFGQLAFGGIGFLGVPCILGSIGFISVTVSPSGLGAAR